MRENLARSGTFVNSALRHLHRARTLHPAELTKQGRYAEAEGQWRSALAGGPDDAFALMWLGVCPFRILRQGGALIFSCELAEESEGALVLRPSRRYAHSRRSVEELCRDAGFARCVVEPFDLRLEANVPVAGFIAVAEKA